MSQSSMRLFICSKKLFDNIIGKGLWWILKSCCIIVQQFDSVINWENNKVYICNVSIHEIDREHQNNPQQLPILGPYKRYEVARGCGVVVSVYSSFAYLCFAITVSWRLTLCFWSMTTFYDLFIMLFITLQIETQWNCVSISNIQSTIHRK